MRFISDCARRLDFTKKTEELLQMRRINDPRTSDRIRRKGKKAKLFVVEVHNINSSADCDEIRHHIGVEWCRHDPVTATTGHMDKILHKEVVVNHMMPVWRDAIVTGACCFDTG